MDAEAPKESKRREVRDSNRTLALCGARLLLSTNPTLRDLDYTTEIASAVLRGDLGLREKPPEWLNEMIPYGNNII